MLELELDVLQKYAAIARQRRNAATSAGRLPAEVLVEIFLSAQEDWKPQRRRGKPPSGEMVSYDLGWLNITHTCNMWRKVRLTSYLGKRILAELPLNASRLRSAHLSYGRRSAAPGSRPEPRLSYFAALNGYP